MLLQVKITVNFKVKDPSAKLQDNLWYCSEFDHCVPLKLFIEIEQYTIVNCKLI